VLLMARTLVKKLYNSFVCSRGDIEPKKVLPRGKGSNDSSRNLLGKIEKLTMK
jgi:hypothetical protein